MVAEMFLDAKKFRSIACAFLVVSASTSSFGQQYVFAPTSASGLDGWVAGWMSNRPPGTLSQDWYPGSSGLSTGPTPVLGDTHDTNFLAGTVPQRLGGGLSASPDATYLDFQIISGLSTNNASSAIDAQQFIEFPFTTGTMMYADSTESSALFYLNAALIAKRWNLNGNIHPRSFGYAAYVVDAAGNSIGGVLQQVDDVSLIGGVDYQFVRAPDGPGPGITLQPGTPYALRFYLYRTGLNADGRASWDDTLFTMSRQAIAEVIVGASTVAKVPTGGLNQYSYTFSVYNNGPDPTTAVISDPLPGVANGVTAAWTCVLQPSGSPCLTQSGAGPISATQPLDSGQTAVYSVSWMGPSVASIDVHGITAQPQMGSPQDPIATNNTATVTLAPASIKEIAPVPATSWTGLVSLASLLGVFGLLGRRSSKVR
ncbi:hypothetical protein G7048_03665 [Diaphorobacter sp. HDW4B]|uniref:hypothetical protein n=1 Tax=Diaphorobacter sp. HDW4B TaxID=2714925 RepID=UPI00140AC807|nr:hypothetical protein [Diaphorobacter sp. HDW4B]QIL69548.1 hypothetical protein G7048_03665 [Diaphorobacter sp. HDW4B]